MAGGRLDIALNPQTEPQGFGLESAELLVAGHAGSQPRPLAKVASGGELSRIALAIAVCTAQADRHGAPTLIFDEIDAGVGGAVAHTVGSLMKQLGASRQVLAVTHLAQVAACADAHWVVAKQSGKMGVSSSIARVQNEARTAEIARMLGGSPTDASLAHAKELLA
jgi:DNA repair protein RecN (Recombination protein N)